MKRLLRFLRGERQYTMAVTLMDPNGEHGALLDVVFADFWEKPCNARANILNHVPKAGTDFGDGRIVLTVAVTLEKHMRAFRETCALVGKLRELTGVDNS